MKVKLHPVKDRFLNEIGYKLLFSKSVKRIPRKLKKRIRKEAMKKLIGDFEKFGFP